MKTPCTCKVPPESGAAHEPTCPRTPLRDAAILAAAQILARITVRKSA